MDHLPKKHTPFAAKISLRPTKKEVGLFISASTLDVDWGEEIKDSDYRTLLREEKRARHESLT